jgi:peptidoglycan/LPS O-acetylase OafA/YrhL
VTQKTLPQFPALDGLRGLAMILVVCFHCAVATRSSVFPTANSLYNSLTEWGWLGVDLFFVLSGFLITRILLASKQERGYFKNFYVRRTLRIFPLYYTFLAIALWYLPGAADSVWVQKHQAWLWLYVSNWQSVFSEAGSNPILGHFWSLSIEEQFYLVWPLIVLFMSQKQLLRFIGLALALLTAWRLFVFWQGDLEVLGKLLPNTFYRSDGILWGAFLATLPPAFRPERSYGLRAIFAIAILVLVGMILSMHSIWVSSVAGATLGLSAANILFAGCCYFCTVPSSSFAKVFSNSWLRLLGRHSYAVYIFHIAVSYYLLPVFFFEFAAAVSGVGSFLLFRVSFFLGVLLVSLGLARISGMILEEPFRALKEKWTR